MKQQANPGSVCRRGAPIVLLALATAWPHFAWATIAEAPASAMVPTNLAGTYALIDVPAGFDGANASAGQLARYGFPPRPDPYGNPAAYRAWRLATQGMARVVPDLQPVPVRHGPIQHGQVRNQGTTNAAATSSNWSGYVVAAAAFNFGTQSLTQIYGDWTIPIAQPAFGACRATPDGAEVYSSTWVGLDGDGSSDVLQAGTESDAVCSQGRIGAYQGAWYEWYPDTEIRVTNFRLSPGAAIYVNVWATSATTGHAYIADRTTSRAVSVAFTAPPGIRLFGNSAEWVVERPSVNGVLADLTNYVQVFMAGAEATDALGNQNNPGNLLIPGRQPALPIQMIDAASQVISVPALLGLSAIWFADQGSAQVLASK